MAERIDIELIDKINPAIAKKLAEIRANAVAANDALANLKKNLSGIDVKGMVSLAKAQQDGAKAATSQAVANEKLAQAVAKTSRAEAEAAAATAKAGQAQANAAISATKLETVQTQLASAQARLTGSSNQAAISQQKLSVATSKAAQAQSVAASAAQKYAQAQQSTQQAILKTATAQQKLSKATSDASIAASKAVSAQQAVSQSMLKTQSVATQLAVTQQKLQQATIGTTTATIKQQQAMVKLQQQQLQLSQAQKSSKGGSSSTGILFGVSAGLLGSEIVDEITNYQNLNNRIRITTASEAEFITVRDKLLEISNKTFTSLESNALVYQRLAPIATRFGVTQEQLFTVITNVNKALTISGSTAEEARGALIQLSQAIGGDFKTSAQELNSILEQAPGIAKVFADQLGVTTSEIKKLAKEGQISSKDFFKAFSDGGKGIAELQLRFNKLIPSLSQLGQVFQNTFTQAVGNISETTGLTTALSKGIITITDNVGVLAAGIAALFPILIGGLVSSEIAMAAFNAEVFKNPFVIGASVFAAAIVAIAEFNDAINGAGDTIAKLRIAAYDFDLEWQHIKISIVDAMDSLYGTHNADPLKKVYNDTIDLRNGLIAATTASEDLFRAQQKLKTLQEQYSKTPTAELSNQIMDAKSAVNELSKAVEKSDTIIKGAGHSADSLDDSIKKAGASGKAAGNSIAKSFNGVTDSINAASNAFMTLNQSFAEYSSRGGAKIIDVESSLRQQGLGGGTHVIGNQPVNSMTGEVYSNLAYGGSVSGPGGPRDDRIPAMLSNGEFVVNASAASKYATLLTAINNSPIHMADGGFAKNPTFQNPSILYNDVGNTYLGAAPPPSAPNTGYSGPTEYLPSEYLPSTYLGTGSEPLQGGTFSLGGDEFDALTASGLEPYIGMNGASGGWKFTGDYSPDIDASFASQAANVSTWITETQNWLSDIMPTLQDPQARSDVQSITDAWIGGFPKYTIDPRPYVPGPPIGATPNPDYNKLEYHFEDVASKFMSAGYAAAILSGSPAWGDTLGNYVQYSGPSYGGSLNYGGDPGDPISYAISKEDLSGAILSSVGFSSGATQSGFSSSDPLASFFDSGNYYGAFRDGGSFIVGGDGGPDSQLVQFLASPEEQVDISKPGDRPEEQTPSSPMFGAMFGPGSVVIRPTGHPKEWKRSEDQVVGDLTKKVFGRAKQMGLVR